MKHKEEPFSFSPIREKNLKKTKSIIPLSSPFSSPTQQNEIIYQKKYVHVCNVVYEIIDI